VCVRVCQVLARLKGQAEGAPTIVAVRQGPLLATAFHPELTRDLRFHRLFVDTVRAAKGLAPLA
jgi:pyridoxal 5'-phosphate synthase pdxT subunit